MKYAYLALLLLTLTTGMWGDGRPPHCPNDPSCHPPSVNPKSCCPGQ